MRCLRILFVLGLVATLLLWAPVLADAADSARIAEWLHKSQAITGQIKDADKKGDYARAVALARQCMAFPLPDPTIKRPYFYCEYYYAKGLIEGTSVARDEDKGFKLLEEAHIRFLDVAELYEIRDPVEAYAIVLEAYAHNICDEGGDGSCAAFFKQRTYLDDRLRRELSENQIKEAEQRALKSNPDVLVNRRLSILTPWALLGCALVGAVLIILWAGMRIKGSTR